MKMRQGERGAGFIKVLMIVAIIGALFSMGSTVVPRLYDYYLLRDLADRVVDDFSNLNMIEVKKRVKFELDRSRINIDGQSFIILPVTGGYRVTIDYRIPMEWQFGQESFSLSGYEEWAFSYEVES